MKKTTKRSIIIIITLLLMFFAMMSLLFTYARATILDKQLQILTLNRDIYVSQVGNKFSELDTLILSVESYINTQSDDSELLQYLVDLDENSNVIASIYFGMPDKTMINSSGFVPPPSFDLTTRIWYQMALINDGVVYTNAFITATNDRVIITVALAVYDVNSSELLGVIGMDIDIRSITSFINDITDNAGGYAFMYDSNNNVIAHSDQILNDISIFSTSDYFIPDELLTEMSGISEVVEIDATEGRIAYSDINNTDYTFGLFMSNSELFQSVRMSLVIILTLIASFIAVGGAILVIVNLIISKPLEALIHDIKKITPEDKFKYRLPVNSKLRLLDVRQALNELLHVTVDYQNQVIKGADEISLSNQKYNLLLDSASDIVFQTGLDKRYKEIYGKGIKTLDKVESDFIGNTFEEVFGIEVSEERDKKYNQALAGKKVYYTWEYMVNEEIVYFETVISPLKDTNKEIIGVVGVTRDITEQQLRYEKMHYISTHDYLTDLYNRKFYIETLERLNEWKQYPFGVVNLDVNGLKIINDAYGHSYGDIALNKTAEVLLETCEDNCIISRVSGDEFAIVIPNATKEMVQKLKGNLIKSFSRVRISNLNLSVAIGYYIKTDDSIDIDEVRKLAENDMYRQKVSERRSVKNKAISAILKTLTEKFSAEKVHSEKVAEYSYNLGESLGLEKDDLRDLKTAGLFHDIGKISIPDNIINKPGKLTDVEYEIMKSHTEVGYEILRAADEYSDLAVHASSHHERFDGKGYPRGLKGEDIPLFSRIICIADAYEAMTSDRPYRKGNTLEYAVSEMIRGAGTQFDPKLAKIFVENVLKEEWKVNNKKSKK